ncbi:MAG: V-type ATP synthase subunit D [Halobacteria archaeon]|nr:V-type ATP synthase subunit D [Halobacteria archaeon]
MPADDVKPTRKNLMEIKDRIELSEQGHDTLEKKRDGLIMEFMEILEEAQDVREGLEEDYDEAQKKINRARALDGDVAVRGAASARAETPEIVVDSKNIMGVVVPQIESSKVKKDVGERGYSLLGTSARIDEAAEAYEELLETIILAAEIETAMKKMLDEIEKTKRRVNALEFKLIPELTEARDFIELRLEEMEREEIFRLKKIKAKKEEEEKESARLEALENKDKTTGTAVADDD